MNDLLIDQEGRNLSEIQKQQVQLEVTGLDENQADKTARTNSLKLLQTIRVLNFLSL
jgi:hypothetical protein